MVKRFYGQMADLTLALSYKEREPQSYATFT